MSDTPVLVIHGVATRDRDAFAGEVERLAESVGAPNPFIPVFWGDLARPQESVERVLPYLDWLAGPDDELDDETSPPRFARMRRILTERDFDSVVERLGDNWRRQSEAARRRILGTLYRSVRDRYLAAAGQFAGDIILYQRRQAEIHARVWETVIREAPGWGVAEQPVHVVTHSLGGSVLFDLAVDGQPRLHVGHLLSCACTAPYFHVIGCSPAALPPPVDGEHVELPPTIGRWTNYFIPLDPWGYLAAPVFRLADGSPPVDVEVHSGEREDRWLRHGASHYWRHPAVIAGVREALGLVPPPVE